MHHEPGTTRDVVGEQIALAGTSCVLMDTAGLRVSRGEVESEGVNRALDAARDADVRVLVIDGSDHGRDEWMKSWSGSDLDYDLLVLTKADLWAGRPRVAGLGPDVKTVFTSTVDGRGLSRLTDCLGSIAALRMKKGRVSGCVIAGKRQADAVSRARGHAVEAVGLLQSDAPLEAAAQAVRASAQALGEVTGAQVTEDVLDRIFARFCLGK
ncbi:MAG: hypothetical protein GXP54_04160 [Deltaproteobacteria bacterium]|nr:hypothetical protein [Deltaproteobacteria bacterium]